MKLIFEYIKRHWISFLLSTMFLTLEAAADLLQPTFMSYIVDRGIKNADVDQILHYGLIMLCIAAVGAAVRFAFGQTRRRLPPISIRKWRLLLWKGRIASKSSGPHLRKLPRLPPAELAE